MTLSCINFSASILPVKNSKHLRFLPKLFSPRNGCNCLKTLQINGNSHRRKDFCLNFIFLPHRKLMQQCLIIYHHLPKKTRVFYHFVFSLRKTGLGNCSRRVEVSRLLWGGYRVIYTFYSQFLQGKMPNEYNFYIFFSGQQWWTPSNRESVNNVSIVKIEIQTRDNDSVFSDTTLKN